MSVTHMKFVGWQICFDTHFYVRQCCVGSCRWVEGVSEADRVGYSPCSKPLAVEGYLLQQMPERGRCFSSSMRQIPRARFILYLYSYLFIPVQLGASQLHTNTMGQHLPLCGICVVAVALLREGQGNNMEVVQCDPKSEQVAQHTGRHCFAAMWESERKTVRTCKGGCLPLWDSMWILLSW